MGFSVQVAHYIGANDFVRARQVFRHALISTTILSIIIATIGIVISHDLPYWLGGGADIASDASLYFMMFMFAMPFFQLANLSGAMLKCSGDMRIPSIISIAMCVMDVVFNYILIFIFHLGVLGVALGTALAIVIGGCCQAYFAIFRNKILALHLDNTKFEWVGSYLRNAFKIGSPMALQSVLMSGAQIVATMIVAPLGNIAIAANTFAITAESLCYMPGYGIGDAATTLVGQSTGNDCYDVHGSYNVCLSIRADGIYDSCRGHLYPRSDGTPHRSLCRTFLCCVNSKLQRFRWCRRHPETRHHEPLFYVARTTDAGSTLSPRLRTARSMDSDGDRAYFPRVDIPLATVLRSVDKSQEVMVFYSLPYKFLHS